MTDSAAATFNSLMVFELLCRIRDAKGLDRAPRHIETLIIEYACREGLLSVGTKRTKMPGHNQPCELTAKAIAALDRQSRRAAWLQRGN